MTRPFRHPIPVGVACILPSSRIPVHPSAEPAHPSGPDPPAARYCSNPRTQPSRREPRGADRPAGFGSRRHQSQSRIHRGTFMEFGCSTLPTPIGSRMKPAAPSSAALLLKVHAADVRPAVARSAEDAGSGGGLFTAPTQVLWAQFATEGEEATSPQRGWAPIAPQRARDPRSLPLAQRPRPAPARGAHATGSPAPRRQRAPDRAGRGLPGDAHRSCRER